MFVGDGEMDEPESLGAVSLAARERLDNLIFVVNCNLQRLDGPVRGNGKIIQELEGVFRGAGWNVIKVIWGDGWDPLLARDKHGLLLKRMEEALDGDYQNYKAKGGAYTREHFFGKYPQLRELVANLTDDDIWRLNRGGHDPQKVYAAYAAAVKHTGQPSVILAKTVKGYGLGKSGESVNISHQMKKMSEDELREFRDRYRLPISDAKLKDAPFYKPPEDSAEMVYLRERREALGGYLPARRRSAPALEVPGFEIFEAQVKGSGEREISTTMAFVRLLTALTRDKQLGPHVVPIVPDEARTFGMEGLFRTLGIYSSIGQLYDPVDADQVMYYHEHKEGQILQEGLSEAGSMSSFIAAGTSYSCHGLQMIPFYIFYSMFGFQRIGDLAWAAGDNQARGFLLGGTSGRTTLAGEGLQHQDGHSFMLASTIPNCRAYDPTFAYELAVILHEGLLRMVRDHENVFYYVTVMNENYAHPPMPEGVREGIVRGMYRDPQRRRREAPRPAARLGRHPARSARRGRAARSGLGGGGRRLELHEPERAAPRRPRLRALEPAPPGRAAAPELGRALPRRAARSGGRGDRLHARPRRPDPPVHRAALQGARHRRLRPQRYAPPPAGVLRGRSPLGRARGAQGARGRRRDSGRDRQRRAGSLWPRPEEAESRDGVVRPVAARGSRGERATDQRPRHRRLPRRGGDRAAGRRRRSRARRIRR